MGESRIYIHVNTANASGGKPESVKGSVCNPLIKLGVGVRFGSIMQPHVDEFNHKRLRNVH